MGESQRHDDADYAAADNGDVDCFAEGGLLVVMAETSVFLVSFVFWHAEVNVVCIVEAAYIVSIL